VGHRKPSVASGSNVDLGAVSGETNVAPNLLQRLAMLANDYGQTINIVSGTRTTEEQQYIWDNTPEASRGITVARPGTSKHESGNAADISDDWFANLGNDVLAQYGLVKPMDYENWHVQAIG